MKKRFVTLFPPSRNVHLTKDVGMIPYIMYRDYGYDSTLVAFRNDKSYPGLEKEVEGLKISFVEEDTGYRFGKPSRKVLSYLWNNAADIDVLNLYHNTKETLAYGLLYKARNPSGILYLKLDLNIKRFEESLNRIKKRGFSLFFSKIADIVSYELDSTVVYLADCFPVLKNKLLKIPNGIDTGFVIKESIVPFGPEEKENLIIVVGRIGAEEKNHEMLLEALARVNLSDWKVTFIGPVDERFRLSADQFFGRNPALKERVSFTGGIADRKELYHWYNRAKVFCLTSHWESFGIVLVEALYFGNYIISTPVASVGEITDNGRVGNVVRSKEELATVLQHIINGEIDLKTLYPAITERSRHFIWTDILASLDKRIKSLWK